MDAFHQIVHILKPFALVTQELSETTWEKSVLNCSFDSISCSSKLETTASHQTEPDNKSPGFSVLITEQDQGLYLSAGYSGGKWKIGQERFSSMNLRRSNGKAIVLGPRSSGSTQFVTERFASSDNFTLAPWSPIKKPITLTGQVPLTGPLWSD